MPCESCILRSLVPGGKFVDRRSLNAGAVISTQAENIAGNEGVPYGIVPLRRKGRMSEWACMFRVVWERRTRNDRNSKVLFTGRKN